ncbi:hypothetical protein [Cryobacterium sp. TMT1-21]|uniref:hypothetical protein n=1 Tax=Cryobacterium sp. TMT1-21 TaxID=1259234 RepID=UPI00106AD772|nr:hypothetical protein [Cryobacterium sp. TMT1-21]
MPRQKKVRAQARNVRQRSFVGRAPNQHIGRTAGLAGRITVTVGIADAIRVGNDGGLPAPPLTKVRMSTGR